MTKPQPKINGLPAIQNAGIAKRKCPTKQCTQDTPRSQMCEPCLKRHRERNIQHSLTDKARWHVFRAKSKKRGIEVSITYEEFIQISSQDCLYCLGYFCARTNGSNLDRIDCDLGYHIDNVVPCCKVCNCIKWDSLSVAETAAAVSAAIAIREYNSRISAI